MNAPFPWALALVALWATGIAFIVGRSAWAYVRFVRRFPASCETPPDWADEWTSLQLEAGLPRNRASRGGRACRPRLVPACRAVTA